METISNGTSNLETLTAQNIDLEPGRQETPQIKLVSLLRELSIGLYQALNRSISCSCAHSIGMRLCIRSSDIYFSTDESTRLQELGLDIALSVSKTLFSLTNQLTASGIWEYVRIVALPHQLSYISDSSALKAATSTKDAPKSAQRRVKRVKIQEAHGIKPGNTVTATLVQSANVASLVNQMAFTSTNTVRACPESIANLCETIRKSQKTVQDFYGFITDENTSTSRQFKVYPIRPAATSNGDGNTVLLRDALKNSPFLPLMTYKDKMKIAVAISTGVLQLYNTPWLSYNLSENIFFSIYDSENIYDNPFILAAHKDTGVQLSRPKSLNLKRDPLLLSLGFLLIELICGPVLTPANEDFEGRYIKAQQLLPTLRNTSLNYFSAVSRCLDDGQLHAMRKDDIDFQHNLYTGVISLLKRDLDYM